MRLCCISSPTRSWLSHDRASCDYSHSRSALSLPYIPFSQHKSALWSSLRKMRRFERIYDVVEPVEEYRAGGYHPVHLEDTFHQRYQVVAKLAFGQFSTVWLAKDTRSYLVAPFLYSPYYHQTYAFPSRLQRYVTLKILKADVSQDSRELSILLHLSEKNTNCLGSNNILQLLDHFEQRGPNGLHLCLVFPVMMSDGSAMTVREKPRYSHYVREISKQILQGLNFIHDQGFIHGGMRPERQRCLGSTLIFE